MLSGYLAALFSALMWGSMNVPTKKSEGHDSFYFAFIMALGVFVMGLLISVMNQSFVFSWWGILTGLMWSTGCILNIMAIRDIGIVRSMPIIQGVIIPVSFLSGIVLFNEWINIWTFALLGLILFCVGAYFLTSGGDLEKPAKLNQGLVFSLFAGLIFGVYGVPFRYSGIAAGDFVFSVSLGITLASSLFYLVRFSKPKRKYIVPAMSSGIIWNLGNYSSFFAISSLGLTLGYPLTQLALFVNIMWGLLYFKEIKSKKIIKNILLGSILLFTGAILLVSSK